MDSEPGEIIEFKPKLSKYLVHSPTLLYIIKYIFHIFLVQCPYEFDANEKLPLIRIFSKSHDYFCLGNIKIVTKNKVEFSRDFRGATYKKIGFKPLFPKAECPQNGCRIEHMEVTFSDDYHQSGYFCEIKLVHNTWQKRKCT